MTFPRELQNFKTQEINSISNMSDSMAGIKVYFDKGLTEVAFCFLHKLNSLRIKRVGRSGRIGKSPENSNHSNSSGLRRSQGESLGPNEKHLRT